MRETFTSPTGNVVATLDFRPGAHGTQTAKIDNGEIIRFPNGRVTATIASRGRYRTFESTSVAAVLIVYGLTATRCNGLPGVLVDQTAWEMPGLAGTAGRD